MIDIQFVRENSTYVQDMARQKGVDVDIEQLLGFDTEKRRLQQEVESLRTRRNEIAQQMKEERSDQLIEVGRQIKEQLGSKEHQLHAVLESYSSLLMRVPNMPSEDTPLGSSEEENQVIETWGDIPEFTFSPKSHEELLTARDMLDKVRAAKISGSRFAYIKGSAVLLQFALLQYTLDRLGDVAWLAEVAKEGGNESLAITPFIPVLPPMMMRTEAYQATGRLKAEEVTYKLSEDDMWLIGSAEHSLCSMYIDEVLDGDTLPRRFVGYSTSFRREAGTYGKDTAGILRMHHFDKIELEVFSRAESSREEHEFLINIQKQLLRELGLSFQVILKCTGDMGDPNARGVDINTWFPSQGQYRETHSADYMTDFQARGLQTRYKRENDTAFVHTNDATAIAMGRTLAAIVENNQHEDGTIDVPEVLRKYMGGREVL